MSKEPKTPKHEAKRIITPMPDDLVQRIDDFRFTERLPSQSEAVRQLLEQALVAWEKKRGAKK